MDVSCPKIPLELLPPDLANLMWSTSLSLGNNILYALWDEAGNILWQGTPSHVDEKLGIVTFERDFPAFEGSSFVITYK